MLFNSSFVTIKHNLWIVPIFHVLLGVGSIFNTKSSFRRFSPFLNHLFLGSRLEAKYFIQQFKNSCSSFLCTSVLDLLSILLLASEVENDSRSKDHLESQESYQSVEDLVVRMDKHLIEHFPNISGISHFVKAPSHKHVGQTVYVVWSLFEMLVKRLSSWTLRWGIKH